MNGPDYYGWRDAERAAYEAEWQERQLEQLKMQRAMRDVRYGRPWGGALGTLVKVTLVLMLIALVVSFLRGHLGWVSHLFSWFGQFWSALTNGS